MAQSRLALQQAAKAAAGGRDPYGLFKEAIASPPDPEADGRKRLRQQQKREHRAAYSRALMKEVRQSYAFAPSSMLWTHGPIVHASSQHHRINGHFTKMIAMREAVRIAAMFERIHGMARAPLALRCARI